VIGKDITRFHCVIWPAMLMAAGIALPAVVWAHGFVMIGGGKLSKSDAELLDLEALIERHGSDAFRYVLLAEAPWDRDRDFPSADGFLQQFDNRYNADLANDLGNLLNRSVSMIQKYRDGVVPTGGETELDARVESARAKYHNHMENLDLHKAIETAMSVVREANGFIDAAKPWSLAKDPSEAARLDDVLAALVRGLASTAVALAPFMPAKSEELWNRLGGEGPVPAFAELESRMPNQLPSESAGVLFPRSDQ
jgi:methionyl-tRNA synthetase